MTTALGEPTPTRKCRVCGCSDENCAVCVARTGAPCHWVEPNLCSACVGQGVDYEANLRQLLKIIGRPGKCRSCDAEVVWIITKTGKMMPLNVHGVSHFADCPNAAQHRKARNK